MSSVQNKTHTAGILQPSFLPWLGYFEQLDRSDTFVLLDDVQFDKNSWRNRNRIKTSSGVTWLTVPVQAGGGLNTALREVRIDNSRNWARKHLSTLKQNYGKAACFAEHEDFLDNLYGRTWEFLLDVNVFALQEISQRLGLIRRIVFSSSLDVDGKSTQRLVNICRAIGATRFYEGAAGRDYIDQAAFDEAGITLEFQDYQHPVYPQLHGEFVSHLSIIDLLLNRGPRSLETLNS